MTTVYFVRHALPNYNNLDDRTRELTAQGLADREQVTAFFENIHLDAIFSSSYLRTQQTVEPLARQRNLPILPVEDFRERKISDNWVADFESYSRRQWADFDYRLPTGESLRQTQQRNVAALTRILEEYEGRTVVIGCHGTSLSTLFHYYNPDFGFRDFDALRKKMPWVVKFTFQGLQYLVIRKFDILPDKELPL